MVLLVGLLAIVTVAALGGWLASRWIESPADAAARTAPPPPSPILVPVERRVLSSKLVTRGTARFGLPVPVAVAPSLLKQGPGRITTLPLRNAQIAEGKTLLTASGRPVFALRGALPAYRDLVPGSSGDDVRQLESALGRLGFDPGPVDGEYDARTGQAVAAWYRAAGWEPFGPTRDQLASIRTLKENLGAARKARIAAVNAANAAELALETARASAAHEVRKANAELERVKADGRRNLPPEKQRALLTVEAEKAKAHYAVQAAEADLATRIAERALVVLDPRQPQSARDAAEAQVEVARAAAQRSRYDGELAVAAAEREAERLEKQVEMALAAIDLAEAAVRTAELTGDMAVRSAIDSRRVVRFEAGLAKEREAQLTDELARAEARLGFQVPVDEIVFIPTLPVRVEEVKVAVGDTASGSLLAVTDNQLSVDSSLALDVAGLVKPGMPVEIDERALGIQAAGVVKMVASTPGTRGVDGFHFYFEVQVTETPKSLEGFSLRLTIPLESTQGEVTAVPLSAVSLSGDGTSRVQVQRDGRLGYLEVRPGLSADGYVEVTPVAGSLEPGELVVVGFENP